MLIVSQCVEKKYQPLTGEGLGWLATIASKLSLMSARHHQRRQLLQLDEKQLQDIGLTRAEALREAAKPFWK